MILQRQIHVINPRGFDPKDHLPASLWRHADCARYFIDQAATGRRDGDLFVPIMATIMWDLFPSHSAYYAVRPYIVGPILECDDIYLVGEKAKGYRLKPEHATMGLDRTPIRDQRLTRKLVDHYSRSSDNAPPVIRYLLGHLRKLDIDAQAALDWVRGQDTYHPADEAAIHLIAAHDASRWIVCPYGRFHTTLTSLRRGARRFLTYRGEPLVGLDVRNSQPLVFALLLRKELGSLDRYDDVRLYVELCQKGDFYEYLAGEWEIHDMDRSTFKTQFFKLVFFAKSSDIPAFVAFCRGFPKVGEVVRRLKPEGNEAHLAQELQRAEANLILGQICTRLARTLPPEAPVFTIYDSLLTTPRWAETIRQTMLEEFAAHDVTPTINFEQLT
jgi:hypothetical protein